MPDGPADAVGDASSEPGCPRLSQAMRLLPLLRRHLVAASLTHPLPSGISIDFLPIVEDGLFGYEIVPDRQPHTFLLLGAGPDFPVLRATAYDCDAPSVLKLVAVDGRALSRDERRERHRGHPRERRFADWAAAADAAWNELEAMFPERPRHPVAIDERRHHSLDEALRVAHAHLARWDPFIQFVGLPKEAERGFALSGVPGEHGELVFQRPDIWMLRWKAHPDAVYESWSVPLAEPVSGREAGRGDLAS